MKQTITYNEHQVAYQKYGNGPSYIFAFHGAMQSGDDFSFLKNTLDNFTIIAFDLPFHGDTQWKAPKLYKGDILDLFSFLLTHFQVEKVHLIAFSIGAKVANVIALHASKNIHSIVFLAPDGFKENLWYKFVTQNHYGEKLFAHVKKHPDNARKLVLLASRLRLINKEQKVAYLKSASRPSFLHQLYAVWHAWQPLKTNIHSALNELKTANIPLTVIIGSKDTTIPFKIFTSFKKNYSFINWHVLPHGHQRIRQESVPAILHHFNTLT